MEKSTKWFLGGSAILGGIALLNLTRLTRFSKEFILNVATRVHSVALTSLVLAVDITFKNPTDATLRLKHPTVTLFDSKANKDANTPILSSTISDAQYTIKPNSETKLNAVLLTLSVLDFNLGIAVYKIITSYIAGRPVTLYARALTQVNGTIPVVQESEVTLARGKKEVNKPLPTPAPGKAATAARAGGPVSGLSGLGRVRRKHLPNGRR